MVQPLLIEIGVEELPALLLLKELPNIINKWSKILNDNALYSDFKFYYTPRRLVLLHNEFLIKQKKSLQELYGAPLDIAFKNDKPTAAAFSFAKKCGVSIDKISKKIKANREVLYFKQIIDGQESKDLLPSMIKTFIKSLFFGKSMRWGNNSESFIRPIRWLGVNFGKKIVKMSLFDISSTNSTFVHRQISFNAQKYSDINEYFTILKKGKVDLFQDLRHKKILEQFEILQKEHNIKIEVNQLLLNEVVAITEYPNSLLGTFNKIFLNLPNEVIITSMREHQRYFPVFKNKKLDNHFIIVSNAVVDDYALIIKGNEKVLHARLSDALFFYENDLKRGLVSDGLEKIIYMNKLGTLADKVKREKKVAINLFNKYEFIILKTLSKTKTEVLNLINRLFEISKADILSEMVNEFSELEGIIGSYYATKLGEDKFISLAIKQQYFSNVKNLPTNHFSALIALAVKFDTLMGLFSINQIPTGSRDPFALRRAATGIIHTAINSNIDINIHNVLVENSDFYDKYELEKLENFFLERFYFLYETNSSIIKSVIASGERNIVNIDKKIKAMITITKASNFKQLVAIFKRVSNIIQDINPNEQNNVNEKYLLEDDEKKLYLAFKNISDQEFISYESKLNSLFSLAPKLANFFDNVMVNVDDENLRTNRKNLIGKIYLSFKNIADIKEITI